LGKENIELDEDEIEKDDEHNEQHVIDMEVDYEGIEVDLEGIEFSALSSGLHEHDGPDFVYFAKSTKNDKKQLMYDVVMRSVGIFCKHYAFLGQHQKFLEKFVEKIQTPTLSFKNKKTLTEYFKNHNETALDPVPSPSLSSYLPSGAFNYLLSIFGPKMFVLWKAMLLQKRILICSEPPVKVLSLLTYATTFLCRHTVKSFTWNKLNNPNPLFFVNISSQIKFIKEQEWNIACTTERVFERKPHQRFYDVFVNIQLNHDEDDDESAKPIDQVKGPKKEVIFTLHNDAHVLNLTAGDKSRYRFIMRRFQAADEGRVISFMNELNNKLFYNIQQARRRTNAIVKPSHMPKYGLHESDFNFFVTLVQQYDVELEFRRSWCDCCL